MDAHASFDAWANRIEQDFDPGRVFFIETWGDTSLHEAKFERGDWLVFGKETVGLTRDQVQRVALRPDRVLKIPMPGEVRSLNLSNAVAVTIFELLRQVDAARLKTPISGVPGS